MNKVNLRELAGQFDMIMDDWRYFVNRRTGEIVSVNQEYLGIAEEAEDADIANLQEWEQEEVREARELLEKWDDLVPFPDKYELNEYEMMEDFIETVKDEHIRDCLSIAINGRGAFRRFKDTVNRFGVETAWYDFKEQALLAFARDWCENNELKYYLEAEEETRKSGS